MKIVKTPTKALKILWKEGFFKEWRKFPEITIYLAKRGNNFPPPDLGMVLKFAKHLTRRGKRGSYEYTQKYPFAKEEKHEKPKKNN
ncbi:unnamed protein product [marine sediment metagenome]|uniref:Uncharacterized protein n=1 Tax=marine sediment metagenome TaxID=412755 RepID=X1GCF8_9ZZZZ